VIRKQPPGERESSSSFALEHTMENFGGGVASQTLEVIKHKSNQGRRLPSRSTFAKVEGALEPHF
jgi:hypothetical protein